jgi:hypothetical protein
MPVRYPLGPFFHLVRRCAIIHFQKAVINKPYVRHSAFPFLFISEGSFWKRSKLLICINTTSTLKATLSTSTATSLSASTKSSVSASTKAPISISIAAKLREEQQLVCSKCSSCQVKIVLPLKNSLQTL